MTLTELVMEKIYEHCTLLDSSDGALLEGELVGIFQDKIGTAQEKMFNDLEHERFLRKAAEKHAESLARYIIELKEANETEAEAAQ